MSDSFVLKAFDAVENRTIITHSQQIQCDPQFGATVNHYTFQLRKVNDTLVLDTTVRSRKEAGKVGFFLPVIGHFKLGHPWSLQNRPPDKDLLFRLGPVF